MILGLSHVFGEVADLNGVVEYWRSNGWTSALVADLPVPIEKKNILDDQQASVVALHYLERVNARHLPGLEFVRHRKSVCERQGIPALSLRLPMPADIELRDPEGNMVTGLEHLALPVIELSVPDVAIARQRLLLLGFRDRADGRDLLEFSRPLFPQRAFSLMLRHDPNRPLAPTVDEGGWNGMSLLVKDLDQIGDQVPELVSRQSFSVRDRETREVGFYSGDGLLVEFLAIKKSK